MLVGAAAMPKRMRNLTLGVFSLISRIHMLRFLRLRCEAKFKGVPSKIKQLISTLYLGYFGRPS